MKKMWFNHIFAFLFVFPLVLHSQVSTEFQFKNVGSPFIQIESIDQQNVANISAMLQDKLGYLWF